MLNLSQRLGIFVKDRKKGKFYKARYFFVDNDWNLIYVSNQAYIEKHIKTSETINEIISKLSNMKKLSFKGAKIGALKLFATLENLPIAHKNCFEIFFENFNDSNIPTTLIVFASQDDDIGYLHDFLRNYETNSQSFKNKSALPLVTIRNNFGKDDSMSRSPEKQQSEKVKHRNEEQSNETFNALMKLIDDYDKNNTNQISNEEYYSLIEDLHSKNNFQLEEHQLAELKNGSSYSGKMRNGKPHGQGTEFLNNGLSYVGEFRNGKRHGLGYIVNSNLDMTYAEFINDRPVGIQELHT